MSRISRLNRFDFKTTRRIYSVAAGLLLMVAGSASALDLTILCSPSDGLGKVIAIDNSNGGTYVVTASTTISGLSVGDILSITAVPGAGSEFVDWAGFSSGSLGSSATTTPNTFYIVTGSAQLIANFGTPQMALTMRSDGHADTMTPGENTTTFYDEGDDANITTEADPGFVFRVWGSNSDDDPHPAVEVAGNATTHVNMNGNYTNDLAVKAYFDREYDLDMQNASGPSSATITYHLASNDLYTAQVPFSVIASGIQGHRYRCTGWNSGNGDIPTTGTATSYGPYNVAADSQMNWLWGDEWRLLIDVAVGDEDAGAFVGSTTPSPNTNHWYLSGASVLLSATPSGEFTFLGWYDQANNLVSANDAYPVTMTAALHLTAKFGLGTGDADLDGLLDSWEQQKGLKIISRTEAASEEEYNQNSGGGDPDNDGLNNALEFSISYSNSTSGAFISSDPLNADTDGDVMDDGYERRGIDPEEMGEIPESLAASPFAGLDSGFVKDNGPDGNPDGDHLWDTGTGYAVTNWVLTNIEEWRGPDLVDPVGYEWVATNGVSSDGAFTNFTVLSVYRMSANPADTLDQSLSNLADTDEDGFDDGFEYTWDVWQQANQTNEEVFAIGYKGQSLTNIVPVWDGVTNLTRRFNPRTIHDDTAGVAEGPDGDVLYDYETGGVSAFWYSDLLEHRASDDGRFNDGVAGAPDKIVRTLQPTWRRCSHPFYIDVDLDGLPDGYEVIYGLDPWRATTLGESEADGERNHDGDWMAFEDASPTNVHNEVYVSQDFDPRTAFAQFYPTPDEMPGEGAQASPNTKTYTNLDEMRGPDGVLIVKPLGVTTNIEDATHPFKYDSDSDGIWDGWEAYVGWNPNDGLDAARDDDEPAEDPPGDGLTALEEFQSYLTSSTNRSTLTPLANWMNKVFPCDPNDKDTDGDNVSDGAERGVDNGGFTTFTYSSGPVAVNSVDSDPVIYGTNTVTAFDWSGQCWIAGGLSPTSADTENDGLPDPWESVFSDVMHGTVDDIYNDPDNDKMRNYQEYWMGATYHWQWDTWTVGQPFYDPADFFTGEPKHWDWYVECEKYPYRYIPDPGDPGWYSTGDPGDEDSDEDGMDDYYETFHGLNPLFGARDLVAERALDASQIPAGVFYPIVGDPRVLPAVNGSIWMDSDADGLINDNEGVGESPTNTFPIVPTHHTDPSPYWMTDKSYPNSWVNLYYQTATASTPVWFWRQEPFYPPNYAYDYEVNEGYDTDNDNEADYDEVVTGSTDPVFHESPIKRRALYLPADQDAWARTRATFYYSVNRLRNYTVEAWVRPLEPASGNQQIIVERPTMVENGNPMLLFPGVRLNFRMGLTEAGIPFAAYNGAGTQLGFPEAKATGTLPIVSNDWTHLAVTYTLQTPEAHGRLTLYVNGTVAAVEVSDEIPVNGRFGSGGTVFVQGAPLVIGAADGNPNVSVSNVGSPPAPSDFFSGWIDEVRVWDEPRSQAEIIQDMSTRLKQDSVFETSLVGRADLVYLMTFDDIQDPDHDGIVPEKFPETASAIRPIDWSAVGWWSLAPHRSLVYTDYQYVPWLQNSVAHVPINPPVDIGDPNVSGTNSQGDAVTFFPNTSNPYSDRHYTAPNRIEETVAWADDMLPLLWAQGDEDVEMWDGGGPGTDPYDSDLDGLPDSWEEAHGLDPLSSDGLNGAYGDEDGDGMNNIAEYLAGTSPTEYLSLPNGYSDFFTWTGGVYRILGEIFTDFDGMEDVWESENGLDPAAYDAHQDNDNDGWSNYAEFQAGSDPNDLTAFPVPTVSFYVKYGGTDFSGNLIVQAYSDARMDRVVDAQFNSVDLALSVQGESVTIEGASVSGTLQHGSIVPGSLIIYRGAISIGDSGEGVLVRGETEYGTIDYQSGTYTLAFDAPPEPDWSADYQYQSPLYYPRVYTFTFAAVGYLREGYNWFFAFIDRNDNHAWDAGEPCGVAHGQPYRIAWGTHPAITIGLTDELPGYGRFSWTPVAGVDEYHVSLYGSGPHIFQPPRVVRAPRYYVHEQDYWQAGVNGLAADTYQWQVKNEAGTLLEDGSFIVDSPLPMDTPAPVWPVGAVLRHAREEFRWTMDEGAARFHILISQTSDMSNPILDVTEYAPFREDDGSCRWVVPLYAATNAATNGVYYWTVQGISPNGNGSASAPMGFTIDRDDGPQGPYSISGKVGYFGKVTNGTFVVSVYANPGAGIVPEGRVLVENVVTSNAWPMNEIPYELKGLWPGSYHVWAHLDQDGDLERDEWETYGFSRSDAYYPQLLTVPPSVVNDKVPVTLTDIDNDRIADDWEYQYESLSGYVGILLTMMGPGPVDGYTDYNNDGVSDYDHYASTPLNSSPIDPDAAGLDGIPLWVKVAFDMDIYTYFAFMVTTVGVDENGDNVVQWPTPVGSSIQMMENGTAEVQNNGVTLNYRLQYSEDLITWTDLDGDAPVTYDPATGSFEVRDATHSSQVGFYRVIMNCTR